MFILYFPKLAFQFLISSSVSSLMLNTGSFFNLKDSDIKIIEILPFRAAWTVNIKKAIVTWVDFL